MFLVVLLTKLFVLMTDLVSQLLFIEAKMLLMNLLKQFNKKNIYSNKVTVVVFVKNLLIRIMKKLETIVTRLKNLEEQPIGVVT